MIKLNYNKYAMRNRYTHNKERIMSIKDKLIELRVSTGMNRKQFCEYFQIPYRTMTDWELGNRTMPEYLFRLMAYKVKIEKLAKRSE